MLSSFRIEGYRALSTLTATPLSRVNLFVGRNNTGKSSILEAIEILVSRGAASTLWAIPVRRGESVYADEGGQHRLEADVRHLFSSHDLRKGASFRVATDDESGPAVTCTVVGARNMDPSTVSPPFRIGDVGVAGIALQVQRGEGAELVPLSHEGHLHRPYPDDEGLPPIRVLGNDQPLARLLSGSGAGLWEKVVLTPFEDQVTLALRIIEPTLERLAAAPRSGAGMEFFVKVAGSDARVPLASMGDGMKRMLALALTMVTSGGGYVLIDDIDTGLHHSVMMKMWQMVIETARKLDIQVFATTHSLDCVTSLASLFARSPELRDCVAVHRLERGMERSIAFTAEDVVVADRHEMELR